MGRLRPADLGAGAAGVALLVVLFLPWYGPGGVPAILTRGSGNTVTMYAPLGDSSGWQAFSVVDVLLALAAAVAIALVLVTAWARGPAAPVAFSVISTLTAAVAVLLVLWRLIDPPNGFATREGGAWMGLVATLLMFVASWAALHDERTPGAVPPDVPRRPAPPA
jgi:hypothetical protein